MNTEDAVKIALALSVGAGSGHIANNLESEAESCKEVIEIEKRLVQMECRLGITEKKPINYKLYEDTKNKSDY